MKDGILIIGATSAIAEATARIYAAAGSSLFLVGRNREKLADIAADLRVRGAASAEWLAMDLNDMAAHASLVEQAVATLGTLGTVLIAHGTLSDQATCEQSTASTLAEIQTNALSVLSLLTLLANYFEERRAGTIAVISSVAGERGRASNYVYGASKAMVTAFLSGLRQRLYSSGVNVLTIKPGFVDTPMTKDFKKGFLWADPRNVARGIVDAIEKRRSVVYLPAFWGLIMFVIVHVPESIFKRLRL